MDRAIILNHGVDLEERQDNAAASSMVATIQFKNNAAPSSMDATMKFKTSPLLCSALQFHVPRRRQGARRWRPRCGLNNPILANSRQHKWPETGGEDRRNYMPEYFECGPQEAAVAAGIQVHPRDASPQVKCNPSSTHATKKFKK